MKKSYSIIQKTNKIIGEYQIIKKIGKGLTAQVFQARSKSHGKVSIKSICPNFYKSKIGQQLIKNEIKLLAKLSHKNVLRFIQKIQENDKVYIVTGFCQGGDLQSYLKKHQKLDEIKSIQLLKQIVEGCLYLRSQQIIHRDIKLSNIFLKSGVPVLADFGFAVYENDNNLMKINAGSPLYMPKQSLTLKQFSQKSDVFAIGICLFQMLTGKTPWNANTQKQLIQNLKTPPMMPKLLNRNISNLILQCLSVDPNKRPTFKEILNTLHHIQSQLCQKDKKIAHLIQIAPENKGDSKTKQIPSINKNKRNSLKLIEIQNKQNIPIKIATKGQKMRSITTYQQSNFLNNICLNQQTAANKKRKSEDFLSKLNPDQFKFLPQSVITKFKLILIHYKKIIGKQILHCEKSPTLQDRDSLIQQVIKCNTEPELCKSIQNFIRRLFRLTKNYKQYPHCLNNLEQLYERVITINA